MALQQNSVYNTKLGNYKIVLVGDSGAGKTTFLTRLLTGEYNKETPSTLGLEVHPLTFYTNYGAIYFSVWDCAGKEEFMGKGGKQGAYYIEAKGVIAMFDHSTLATGEKTVKGIFDSLDKWLSSVYEKTTTKLPSVVCENKVDVLRRCSGNGVQDTKDILSSMDALRKKYKNHIAYCPASACSCYNLENPFLDLARKLTGHEDLEFVPYPPITAPEVKPTPPPRTPPSEKEEFYQIIIGIPPPNEPSVMFVPTRLVTKDILAQMKKEDTPEFLFDEDFKCIFPDKDVIRDRKFSNGILVKRIFVYST